MKKTINILLVGLLFAVMLSACAIAPADGASLNPSEVTAVQMYVIGIFASAMLYGLKLLAARFPQIMIKREWMAVLLYVVALILSVVWGGVVLPSVGTFSDPITFMSAVFGWVTALLIALSPAVAFATLIYNILLKRVFDGWAGK